jgi:hypothetical protein
MTTFTVNLTFSYEGVAHVDMTLVAPMSDAAQMPNVTTEGIADISVEVEREFKAENEKALEALVEEYANALVAECNKTDDQVELLDWTIWDVKEDD